MHTRSSHEANCGDKGGGGQRGASLQRSTHAKGARRRRPVPHPTGRRARGAALRPRAHLLALSPRTRLVAARAFLGHGPPGAWRARARTRHGRRTACKRALHHLGECAAEIRSHPATTHATPTQRGHEKNPAPRVRRRRRGSTHWRLRAARSNGTRSGARDLVAPPGTAPPRRPRGSGCAAASSRFG